MTTTASNASPRWPSAASRQLHVVHGVLSLELGGLERLVLDLVREGRRRDQLVSVICVEKRGRLAPLVEEAGGQVFNLGKPPGRHAATVEQAGKLLASLQPDIIHTHQVGALWYLGQAARGRECPVLHTEHSDHVAHARGWAEKLKVRLLWHRTAALTDRFCCVSEDIARSVRRFATVPRSKVDVVLNGIDVCRYATTCSAAEVRAEFGIPPGALVVGTVGRLVEVKRQDLLIRAFAQLFAHGRHPHTWLLVVGDGPERQRLESLARRLNVREQVVFAGYQSQPERMLRAMDVFVLTSRHEGLPLALLEAWAAGLAVVSSSVGAIPQTVLHGISGLLFPSGDVGALAETLSRLLDAPWLISQLGRRGKARVEHRYSLARMADEYEQHYRALTAKQEVAAAR
jgi:glycosyltransferase involved in cell wall biosynthesis